LGEAYLTLLAFALHNPIDVFSDAWFAARILSAHDELGDALDAGYIAGQWSMKQRGGELYNVGIKFKTSQEIKGKKAGKKSADLRSARVKRIVELAIEIRRARPFALEGRAGEAEILRAIRDEPGEIFMRGGKLLSRRTLLQLWEDALLEMRLDP
jgi:hypothetical protein